MVEYRNVRSGLGHRYLVSCIRPEDVTKHLYLETTRTTSPTSVQTNMNRIVQEEVKGIYVLGVSRFEGFIATFAESSSSLAEDVSRSRRSVPELGSASWAVDFLNEQGYPQAALAILYATSPRESETSASKWRGTFLDEAKQVERMGRANAALDVVYQAINRMLNEGQLTELDSIVASIDPAEFSLDLQLAVLTATLPAKSRLRARTGLLHRVEQFLKEKGDFEDDLLMGL